MLISPVEGWLLIKVIFIVISAALIAQKTLQILEETLHPNIRDANLGYGGQKHASRILLTKHPSIVET
jgi:hypothetical protein